MDYEIDDDPTRIQPDVVWAYLSTEAYWGRWRTRADVDAHHPGGTSLSAGASRAPAC